MNSPRLLLAVGSVAASLAGVVPAIDHSTASAAPVQSSRAGLTVAAADASSTVVVPAGTSVLRGTAFGSPALARQIRLSVVRASDGATLFTGSLATFHTLPVVAGTKLVVVVQRPDGYAGLNAGAALSWA